MSLVILIANRFSNSKSIINAISSIKCGEFIRAEILKFNRDFLNTLLIQKERS